MSFGKMVFFFGVFSLPWWFNVGFFVFARISRCWFISLRILFYEKYNFWLIDELFFGNFVQFKRHWSSNSSWIIGCVLFCFLGPGRVQPEERILLAGPTLLSTIPEASSLSTEVLFPCYSGERVCINLLVSHLSEICVWLYCCVQPLSRVVTSVAATRSLHRQQSSTQYTTIVLQCWELAVNSSTVL